MPKQLTAQTATITTATVEVKTLTISGKQVTLAVFRQLPESPLINDEGNPNGQPWGTVNYCPDKKYWDHTTGQMTDCATGPLHVHVVWQKNNELHRARVQAPGRWEPFYPGVGDFYVQAASCASNHSRHDWARPVPRNGGREVDFHHNGVRCAGSEPQSGYAPGHECLTAADLESAKADLAAEIADEQARRQRHKDQWQALMRLPQLFIAV